GWPSVLDALRAGRFFVTTGEVLIREFTVDGRPSGETVKVRDGDERPTVKVTLEWTFPPKFAEVVSGDGDHVDREQIDLSDAPPFGHRTLTIKPNLAGRKWVRFAAWDIAAD